MYYSGDSGISSAPSFHKDIILNRKKRQLLGQDYSLGLAPSLQGSSLNVQSSVLGGNNVGTLELGAGLRNAAPLGGNAAPLGGNSVPLGANGKVL